MNQRRWGFAALGSGAPWFRILVRLELANLGSFSIYGTGCFPAYTIIFLGKHLLRCVLTSALFDIPWLVAHDVYG